MTLGYVQRAMRLLEARIEGLEEARNHGKDEMVDDGSSAFTDEQTAQIKALIDERAEVHAGRAFFRLVVWSLGAACIGTASILVAYFKLKGG
jgi:hypothetical protein